METAPTTHEARARNAKAQVFAAILHEHKFGRLNRPGTLLEAVRSIKPEHWSKMAELATLRNMQGVGVTVHPPHSQATVDAVARILGDLIAAEADRVALAVVHGSDVMTADLDADTPDAWCDDDDRAEAHAEPTVYETPSARRWDGGAHSRRMVEMGAEIRRTARASQGYNAVLARIAPQPETTEDALFAPFGQAVNR